MNKEFKIALIGGTGKAGRYIASRAVQNGYTVRMLARDPGKVMDHDSRIEVAKGSVHDTDTVKTLLEGCQAVVNTFGQPPKEAPLYSRVTQNILNTMEELEINRYIGVTGGSLTLKGDEKSLLNKLGARIFKMVYTEMIEDKKKEANLLFENKDIQWTLFRLPFVIEGAEAGVIKADLLNMPGLKITNQDIAGFIVSQIESKQYIHKSPFIAI